MPITKEKTESFPPVVNNRKNYTTKRGKKKINYTIINGVPPGTVMPLPWEVSEKDRAICSAFWHRLKAMYDGVMKRRRERN